MASYELVLRCTVDVVDNEPAELLARETIRRFIGFQERERGTEFTTSDGASPEVVSHELTEDERVVASWCLMRAVFGGFAAFPSPCVTVANISVEHAE